MDLGLENKIVLISGATGGIGTAVCSSFLRENSLIVPLYRSKAKCEILLDYLKSEGFEDTNIFPRETDLGNGKSIETTVKNVMEKFGRIDILINNAGYSTERPFLLLEEKDWEKEIEVNLNNTARLIRVVLKQMFIAKKGAIVNVTSILSQRFGRGVSAYAAAKAGIDRLTQALALEVGAKGIRINSVCPGIVDTPMSKPLVKRLGDSIIPDIALGRFARPEEIAYPILFLASDKAASYITGHLMRIDGGYGI